MTEIHLNYKEKYPGKIMSIDLCIDGYQFCKVGNAGSTSSTNVSLKLEKKPVKKTCKVCEENEQHSEKARKSLEVYRKDAPLNTSSKENYFSIRNPIFQWTDKRY